MSQGLVFFYLAVCILGNPYTNYGQTPSQTAKLDSLFEQAYQLGVFNGNILVAKQGRVIYQRAIGQADATGRINLTIDDRFHLGSIAKEFDAVGIMMLKEQDKLRLDDPIAQFLPELPSWAKQVKVRHLLNYTSGIPQSNWPMIKGDADNLHALQQVTNLDFTPGTKYNYNNNDVFLRRRIIERVTGLSFSSFVQERMFKLCGIKKGLVDPNTKDKGVARGYSNQGKQDDFTRELSGWVALNLQDFYQWSESINAFKLITSASTQELLRAFAPDAQTGLGTGSIEGNRIINHVHDGTSRDYQALLMSDLTTTIILLTNNKQNNLRPISRSIQAILTDQPYTMIRRSFVKDFENQLEQLEGAQIIALYEQIKAQRPTTFNFISETLLNEVGYFLVRKQKLADAVTVFTYNTRLFPTSANVFDSLGEAYYLQGNKAQALANYEHTLLLDPKSESAKKMIAVLKQ